jgi:uncharacterized lipoprotein NlpE involved in copper resistance
MRLFFILCYSCLMISSTGKAQSRDSLQKPVIDNFKFLTVYKGTLQCADCPGIVTELKLNSHTLFYAESDRYLEKRVTKHQRGKFNTERGYKKDKNATVYVLDVDKPGHERRFLKINEDTILMLDSRGDVIGRSSKFKLFRVK